MKTIVIAHNYTLSNFSAMSYQLAHFLAEKGYKVIFITHRPKFSEIQFLEIGKGSLTVYSWPSEKRPTTFKDFIWYAKIHLKYKPNFVIGHFVGGNISIMTSRILSLYKTKTFDYYHTISGAHFEDLDIGLKYKFFFLRKRLFYQLFCSKVICPSEIAKADLKSFFNYRKGIVIVNPMTDRYKDVEKINSNKIIISYLGRFEPTKGIIDLILAFKEFKKINQHSKIVLNLAGGGSQQQSIESLIQGDVNIVYHGNLPYDRIDEYLRNGHFTIIPSKFDNLPTVGLESLMNAIPLLISNTTGLSPYMKDEINCYIFPPTKEAIVKILEKVEINFQRHSSMSNQARLLFEQKFSMAHYCTSILKILS